MPELDRSEEDPAGASPGLVATHRAIPASLAGPRGAEAGGASARAARRRNGSDGLTEQRAARRQSGSDGLAEQLAACLVRNAACVLADIKPAALFSFTPHTGSHPQTTTPLACPDEDFPRAVRRCAWGLSRTLAPRGLRVDVLFTWERRALILVSRTRRVCELLACPDVCSFLQDVGYLTDSPQHVLSCLRRRLRRYEDARAQAEGTASEVRGESRQGAPTPSAGRSCPGDCARCPHRERRPWGAVPYPHEVGVLLGYPLSDVRAFIERQGQGAIDVGPWKVYGNADQARRRWERMRACEQELRRRWDQGASLEALVS